MIYVVESTRLLLVNTCDVYAVDRSSPRLVGLVQCMINDVGLLVMCMLLIGSLQDWLDWCNV